MSIEFIELPYETDALDPVITKSTIDFHYGKHLKTYVDKANDLMKETDFENMTLEEIVKQTDGPLYNNAAQVLNHNLYFLQFKPTGNGKSEKPVGKLAQAIDETFGSFENFSKSFEENGVGLFGSGWVFLSKDKDGKLVITKEPNAGNPITKGMIPILTFDVWEHAYYLDYQNRRADYLKQLWKIVNWDEAEKRFE